MRLDRLPAMTAGILFALSFVAASQAQQKATLTATVTDPSGAAVVGADVSLELLDSGVKPLERRTNPEGKFSLSLVPGRYRIVIRHPSFAPLERDLSLAAGEMRSIDFHVAVETFASTVVVTAAAEPQLASNAASPVDVLTRQEIDERQQIWLMPLLTSLPGTSFSQLGPMGGVTTFFLDGGNSNYTRVLLDGIPVDFSNLSADEIDKIELVHGASSALYGSDAMTGVLQIFTHRGSTRTPEITLQGDGGMFDTGHGNAEISERAGLFDYSLGGSYFDSNGQGAGDYFRDATFSGNFGWTLSDTDSLRLTVRNASSDAGQPGQTLFPSVPFAVDYGQHSDLHDFAAGVTWDFKTGDHWEHTLSGYDSRLGDTEVSPAFDSTSINKFNRAGLDGQSTYTFPNGGVTAGYAFENETGGAFGRHDDAGYIEVRRQFGPRFTAIAGGRVEANDSYGTRAVPRVGASYLARYGHGFWGATRLRSSFGEGIKEPPLFPSDCTPILKPEQSTTADAGVDQYFASDRVRFSATFFHNDFRDIVSFTSAGPENCPAFFGSYFNTDLAHASGAYSSFELRAASWLRIAGNYSYDDSKVLKAPNATDPALVPGNRLFKRPLHSANLVLNARFHRMNWNVAGYYVGRETDSDFLGLGITSDPSYVVWDLANSIDLSHGFSTVAAVNNLFNRHYEIAVGYPALRLNYRLGLKYAWGKE
jgi:outer membrane cobalamin receptor